LPSILYRFYAVFSNPDCINYATSPSMRTLAVSAFRSNESSAIFRRLKLWVIECLGLVESAVWFGKKSALAQRNRSARAQLPLLLTRLSFLFGCTNTAWDRRRPAVLFSTSFPFFDRTRQCSKYMHRADKEATQKKTYSKPIRSWRTSTRYNLKVGSSKGPGGQA